MVSVVGWAAPSCESEMRRRVFVSTTVRWGRRDRAAARSQRGRPGGGIGWEDLTRLRHARALPCGGCVDVWVEESSALGWGFGVDAVALAVDHDLVVEPAQGGEVLGIRPAVVGPRDRCGGSAGGTGRCSLRWCSRVASRCRMNRREAGWDDPGAASEGEGLPVSGACGDFNDAATQDRFDGVRSDPRSGFQRDTGRAVGRLRLRWRRQIPSTPVMRRQWWRRRHH